MAENPRDKIPMNATPTDNDDVKQVLENLIEIARDGQEGYRLAAEHAHDPGLKQAFIERSARRSRFVSQLQQLQTRYGQSEPDSSGSVTGGLHRAWINMRSVVSSREDQAILEEAERGEDAAVEAYREALLHDPCLPEDAIRCVESQASAVKEDQDFMKRMRDSGRFDSHAG